MRNYFLSLIMAIALLATCQMAEAQQTTLLNETFDNITTGVPTGWDNSDYDCGQSYVWQSDASGYNGTRGMKFNTYSAYSGTYSTLKTPVLNLSQPMYLKFKYQNYQAGQLDVYISLDGGATYTTAIDQNLTTATSSEWGEAEYSLSAYQGNSNVKIVFKGTSNYGYQRQYIDDVVVESAPTCKNPKDIYISNLTTTSATLNWSLSNDGDVPTYFQLLVTDAAGNTIVNNNQVPGSSITYSLTGLSANTSYSVSMRGDCNQTLSGYSKYETFQFRTACNTSAIPYTENFDGLTGLPDCTNSLNCSIDGIHYGTSGKSLKLATTVTNSSYIVFPLLSHAANDLEVTFEMRGSSSTPVVYQVGVIGDMGDIEGSFEPLYSDSIYGSSWQDVRMNTAQSSYTTSPSAVCIYIGSGVSTSIYVDNVSIHQIPSCVRPEQFRAYNQTAYTVDVAWTTSSAVQHIIYITDANNAVTRQIATTNPYTVTGLQPNSTYTLSVRALCSATDSSEVAAATPSITTDPTCLPVSNIALGSATLSSNTITWSASRSGETSWVLAYTLRSGSVVVSSDSLTLTSPSYTFTGLSSATSYTVSARVYALCSATDMAAGTSFNGTFSTLCGTVTTFPYIQDFESGTVPPNCWSQRSIVNSNYWRSNSTQKHAGSYSAYIADATAGSVTALSTGELSFTDPAGYQVSFWMYRGSSYQSKTDEAIHVYVASSDTADLANATEIGVVNQHYLNSPAEASTGWYQYTFDVPTSVTGSQYVIFCYHNQYGTGAYIDDVMIRTAPTCRDMVGNATVYDVQPTSARVAISDTTATTWDLSYGPAGTAAGAGTIITVSGRMDTIITGLTTGTAYDVYVRRNCGTEYGMWTLTAVQFTCACQDLSATISDVDAHSFKVTTDATTWEISYGPLGTTAGGGTIVPVSGSTEHTVTGLSSSTNYVVYVRRNCGTVYSDWSASYTVHTTSVPDSLPFSTGFENSADDGGWTIVNGSSSSNVFTIGNDANAVRSGSRALYMSTNNSYGYNNSSSTKTYAYRTIYLPAGVVNFSFAWKCTGGESNYDFGRVMLVPASETITGGSGSSYTSTTFPNYTHAFDPAGANKMNLSNGDATGWNLYEEDVDMTSAPGTYFFVIMWNDDSSAGSDFPIAIDNVSISQVTCNKPTVTVTGITASGATVTASSQTAQQFEVAVSTTPIDVFGTVSGDIYQGVTSAPVSFASLQPNTPFYYSARAICGVGDTSRWADAQSSRSACAAYNVPYTEGFEDSGVLSCWSGDMTRNTSYHYAGSASCKVNNTTAVSPEMNVSSLATYMLNGWAYSTSDSALFTVGAMTDPSDPSSYTDLVTVTVPTRNTWTEFTTYFTLLNDPEYIDFATAKHFAINAGANVTVYVDDLYLGLTPTCPKPTEVALTNVTSTACDVAWTNNATSATSWIIKAVPMSAGAVPVTQTVTTNPATISGLSPASTYSIQIAALCSATDTSLWTNGGNVTTACAVVNAPYEETFEYQTDDQTPNCWDISSSTTSTATSNPSYVWGVYSHSSNKMIRLDNWSTQSGNAVIVSPTIALAAGTSYTLRFDYSHRADCGDLNVDISSDNGTTWQSVGTYSEGTSESQTDPGTWTTVNYGLNAYAGSSILIRFSTQANYGDGAIFVDNVKVRQNRSCADIVSLSVNAGETDAFVTISDTTATHTQWQYMCGALGFDTTGVTPTTITTDTFSVTGLTAATTYTLYVRAYCDASNQSNWTVAQFTTTATPASFPYVCHFTNTQENNSWQINTSGTNGFVIGTDANSCSTGETAALYVSNNNSTYSYTTSSASSQSVAYRLFRFMPMQYTLHLSWRCDGGESNYDFARFYLIPATSGEPTLPPSGYYSSSSWPTNIIALDGGSPKAKVTSPTWNDVDMTLDMTNQSGSYYLVFNWVNDASAGTSSYPFAVNDIEINALTCTAPVATVPDSTITTTSATVYYTDPNSGSTIRYWYNTTGLRADSANIATATGSPISLTNLSPSSNYYLFMQAFCSATDHSVVTTVPFQTACGVITTYPYTEGFEGETFAPNCWNTVSSSNASWAQYTPSYTPSSYVHSGNHSAYVTGSYYTTDSALLATPLFHFDSLREYNLHFYMYSVTGTYYTSITDQIQVYLSSNNATTAGATLLGTAPVSGTSGGMHEFAFDLPAYTSGDYYLIFVGTKNDSWTSYTYLDDVTVDVYPTCRDLSSAPTIVSTTATTMTVSAPKGPNHQGIIFAYAPSTGTSVADTIGSVYSTSGTAVITGLTSGTSYKVYARGVCSATDSTAWTTHSNGTTMASDCFEPQNLRVVGQINATDITFAWGGAPDASFYEWQCNGVTDTVYTDTAQVTGLQPKGNYTFQVRANCSGSTTSWVSYSFTTIAVPATLPYVCTFEVASEANQWEYDQNTANYFIVGTATSNGGSSSLYITNDGSANAYTNGTAAVSYAHRFFQFTAGQYAYSFDWNCNGESSYDYARAFLVPDSYSFTADNLPSGVSTTGTPSGWISLDNNSKMNQVSDWQTYSGIFTVPSAGNYYLTFLWRDDTSAGTNPPIAIDNVQIARLTCPAPTVTVIGSSISQNSADILVYNPNTSDTLVYAVSNGSVSDAFLTDTVIGADTLHLTGLAASASYNVYVKVICGVGDESFWSSASFRTLCGVSALPYSEDFSSLLTSYSTGLIQTICWDDLNASNSEPYYYGSTQYTNNGHSLQLVSSNSTDLYLFMPSFGNIGNCRVTFDLKYESITYSGQVDIGYTTDVTSESAFVSLNTVPRSNTTLNSYTFDLAGIPSGARLALRYGNASSSNYWAWLSNLRVSQLVQGPVYNDTICYNTPYVQHGFNVPASSLVVGDNVLSTTISGAAGSPDTAVVANVYMRANIQTITYDSICAGDTLHWHGYTITNPQSRAYTLPALTSVTGCDSIVTLMLTVLPTFTETFDSICEGDVYHFHGQQYTLTGDYYVFGSSPRGCNDTALLHLFVVPTATTLNAQTCKGTPYVWHGVSYSQTGTYTWSGTGAHGCSMTETLNLNVIDGDSTASVTICPGGQYVFQDTIITTAGTYKRQYYDYKLDCYITITLTVTVGSTKIGDVYDDACEGYTYRNYGIVANVTRDTVISVSTKTAQMCDSITNVHIKFHNTERTDTFVAIHTGETFTWHNNTYNAKGDYADTMQTIYGCDSIVTLHLDVKGVGVDNVDDVNMTIVPNPLDAGATALVYGDFGEAKSVEILNNFGQVIDRFEPKSYPIEVSGINASGLYYVRITTVDGRVHLQKLIVK